MIFKKKKAETLDELIEYIQFRCSQLGGHHWIERRGETCCDLCQKVQSGQDELFEMQKGFADNIHF